MAQALLEKNPVSADVEAKALVADGAGDAADVLRILFHDHHWAPDRRELVRRGEAAGACPMMTVVSVATTLGDAARARFALPLLFCPSILDQILT